MTIMEIRKERRAKGKDTKMDGRLFKRKRNENRNKRREIRLENSRERSTTGVSIGTNALPCVHKRHAREDK